MKTSIAPWLSVRGSHAAVAFYKSAFGAVEVFRLEAPDGALVARLSIQDAEFWVSDESPENGNYSPETLGGGSVRMILTVNDPDSMFSMALKAGSTQVSPMNEEHGWRSGSDWQILFGHHWEIGRPL